MTRKDLSDLIFSKIEKNQDILSKQFEDSKNKIGFFYVDDLLPEEIAFRIHDNFPKSSEMVLKKSIRENKYIAAQMNLYHPILEDIIYAFQEENGFNETEIDGMTGFVFSNRFGNVHNPQAINRAIKRIYEAYNVEEVLKAAKEKREPILIPHFSCHHLRHTFCSRFCENETNLKVIQSIMGHANIETTMDIYAEVTDTKKQEAIQNLAHNLDVF